MTNEQKKQLLGYLGYILLVSKTLLHGSYVGTPTGWKKYVGFEDILSPEYDKVTLELLIDKAWKHHEAQERILQLEYLVYDAGFRNVMGNQTDEKLYNELCKKFGGKNHHEIMATLYQ